MQVLFGLAVVLTTSAMAQQVPRVQSPEVRPDRRVTFRFLAPNGKDVSLVLEGADKAPMKQDDNGIWTITTDPLEPDLYGYSFLVDGVDLVDPNNTRIKPNLLSLSNVVHVPGRATLLWEVQDVPHGEVHHHFYKSSIVGEQRDFYVYTPPGYDPKSKTVYPVLYLLHGFSDDASAWTAVGQANIILDNLIAQGKARPMIVVMPLGYGAPEMLSYGFQAFQHEELRQRNFNRFRETLLKEIMPQVEAMYPILRDGTNRAIAGLSMGGAESLLNGLNNIDTFAWIGAFSSGGLGGKFASDFPSLNAAGSGRLRQLWIACGEQDHRIDDNRRLKAWLKSQNVSFTDIETPGAHTWMVWRRNLIAFSTLLFR